MARRTAATIKRPPLHVYKSTETPGACDRCHLVKRNEVHVGENDPRLIEQDQAQEEHRRRVGEQL